MAWLAPGVIRSLHAGSNEPTFPAPPGPPEEQEAEPQAFRALLERLGDAEPKVRRDAVAALIALGRPASAGLERVVNEAPDPQTRAGAAEALGRIAATAPTLVTLNMKDVPADQAFAALAQEAVVPMHIHHVPGRLNVPDALLRAQQTRITVAADRQPFFAVLRDLCAATDIRPQRWKDENGYLFLHGGGGAWSKSFTTVQGAFAVHASMIKRDVYAPLGNGGRGGEAETALRLDAMAEPRIPLLYVKDLKVTACVDDAGRALLALPVRKPEESGPSENVWGLWVRVTPTPESRRIVRMSGSVTFVVASCGEAIEVQDVLQANKPERHAGGVRIALRSCQLKYKNEHAAVSVLIYRDGRDDDDWEELSKRVRLFPPRLLDREGVKLSPWAVQTERDAEGLVLQVMYRCQVWDGDVLLTKTPNTLSWDVPVRVEEVPVEFKFEDVPLP
jgi:hypothetical protein